jgi:MFS superfamily sulfate permease-like transporter
MRFVSRSVITGFVNALAILIFMAQLPELTNVTWHVCHDGGGWASSTASLHHQAVPSPLVAIVVLTPCRRSSLSRHPHRRRHGPTPTGGRLHCLMCR